MVAEKYLKKRVLSWWREHKQDFPWRHTADPYAILVSEIMLQQTRAQTVIYNYTAFLEKFPNWQALAQAGEDEVLKACESMGYYRRFHALREIAQCVVREGGGKLPTTKEKLLQLPGVGDYTASAVACFAFGKSEATVDGNLKRVVSRLFSLSEPMDTSEGVARVKQALLPLIAADASAFQQALMDIGQTICLPRVVRCKQCPLLSDCQAYLMEAPLAFPKRKRSRKALPLVQVVAGIVVSQRGRILLTKRRQGAFLSGLWELPGGKVEQAETEQQALLREFQEEVGVTIEAGKKIGTVRHGYTHFKVDLHIYRASIVSGTPKAVDCQKVRWVSQEELSELPLTAGTLKIFSLFYKV